MRPVRALRRAPALVALALVMGLRGQAGVRETIDIGVEDAAAPWSQADGTGYANDQVRAAFRAVNIDVRMHVLPYARCKQYVLNGQLVACVSMSPAPELEGAVRFSAQPLFVFTCEYYENVRRPIPRRIEELPRGTRVGTVIGYEYPPDLLAHLARRGARVEPASSEAANLRKLAAGRIAVAIVNSDAVKSPEWVAAQAGVTGKVRSVYSIGAMPAYIGFGRVHRRGRALADQFDRGFARIVASGERDRIQRRWIAHEESSRK